MPISLGAGTMSIHTDPDADPYAPSMPSCSKALPIGCGGRLQVTVEPETFSDCTVLLPKRQLTPSARGKDAVLTRTRPPVDGMVLGLTDCITTPGVQVTSAET